MDSAKDYVMTVTSISGTEKTSEEVTIHNKHYDEQAASNGKLLPHVGKYLCIDFEVTDDEGRTPLHYMYRARSKKEVAQFLEAAKKEYNLEFNINALDHDRKTPIQLSEKM